MHPIGEVVLIRIGFHQGPGGKVQPAIIVLDSGDDDVVAAPVTSRAVNHHTIWQLPIGQAPD